MAQSKALSIAKTRWMTQANVTVRHTSKRIFERLREERGFTGGIAIREVLFASPSYRQPQRSSSAEYLMVKPSRL